MPGVTRTALSALALSILGPWLVDRYQALSTIGLRPLSSPTNTFQTHEIVFQDRLRNCEDVYYHDSLRYAILSCDSGRDNWNTVMGTFRPHEDLPNGQLWLYADADSKIDVSSVLTPFELVAFPHADDFHPLGIELDVDAETLYVVSHAQAGSCIEVFRVDLSNARLTYVETIRHPAKIVARVPFANGIAALNDTTLAVASSSKPGVYLYDIQSNHDLNFKRIVRTEAAVDNLSVDSSGTLLLAGHPSALELMKVSKGRPSCGPESEVQAERDACGCTAPSWTAQWSEKEGLKTLYKGYDFCTSSTIVRDAERAWGMVTGLYDRGVMILREAKKA